MLVASGSVCSNGSDHGSGLLLAVLGRLTTQILTLLRPLIPEEVDKAEKETQRKTEREGNRGETKRR